MTQQPDADANPDADLTPPTGIPMAVVPGPRLPGQTGGSPPGRDDTTRYLCAAAHLDRAYADAAIKEFLVEPKRSVAPSPGVRTESVLGEAVAARTRRKLRDGALIGLFVGFLFVAPTGLVVLWLVVAMGFTLRKVARKGREQNRKRTSRNVGLALTSVGLLVIVLAMYSFQIGRFLEVFVEDPLLAIETLWDAPPGFWEPRGSRRTQPESGSGTAAAFVLLAGILAVLLTDRLVVHNLITSRFRKQPGGQPPAPSTSERPVFSLSPPRFIRQLQLRYLMPRQTIAQDQPPEPAPVPIVVYRGFEPFVGAGETHRPWSIAVPLQRTEGRAETVPLSTALLYQGILDEVSGLRTAIGLTPGRRLGQLRIDERIIVSADELIDHAGEHETRQLLYDVGHAPYDLLSSSRARRLRTEPLEWARYYLCFWVETWDRDLVMSVYLHVAMDDSTLYVEWTPCVLGPIKSEYQRIDTLSRSPLRPIGQSVLRLLTLPATLPGRLRHTLALLRPLREESGVVDPDKFGSLHSLREMAADHLAHNYFQLTDRDRYLKILESRVVLAVSRIMSSAGYSAASFEAQAAAVFNTNVHIAGSVGGHVVVGTGNTAGDVAMPAQETPQRTERP